MKLKLVVLLILRIGALCLNCLQYSDQCSIKCSVLPTFKALPVFLPKSMMNLKLNSVWIGIIVKKVTPDKPHQGFRDHTLKLHKKHLFKEFVCLFGKVYTI